MSDPDSTPPDRVGPILNVQETEKLKALMEAGNEWEARNAAVRLAQAGYYDERVIRILCGLLLSSAGNEEYTAQELLRGVSIGSIIYPMFDGDEAMARGAAEILYRRQEWAAEDPAALLEAARWFDSWQKDALIDFLLSIEIPPSAFAKLLNDVRNATERMFESRDILKAMGPRLPDAVMDELVAMLESDDVYVRWNALVALSRVGPRLSHQAARLQATLYDEIPVCYESPETLESVLGEGAIPLLAELFIQPEGKPPVDGLTRQYMVEALGRCTLKAKESAKSALHSTGVQALRNALLDPDERVQSAAQAALKDCE
jgi:HEAT repeat protein